MMRTFITLFIFLITGVTAICQEWQASLDSLLTELSENGIFNGQVVLSEDGKMVFNHAYGSYTNEALTQSSALPIASLEKTLTASAIVKLAEEGMVRYDDPITKYIPELPYKSVTTRHLLNQTSGIPNFLGTAIEYGDTSQVMGAQDILDLISRIKPESGPPGEKFAYNNSNFFLCRQIIEAVSELSYGEFMQEYFFEPLDMSHTYVVEELDSQYENITVNNFYRPGGEIRSTATDLFKFYEAYMGTGFIDPNSRQMAFTRPELSDRSLSNYGFGWYIHVDAGDTSVGHWGGGESVKNYLELYFTENRSLIILSVDCTIYMDKIYAMIRNVWEGKPYVIPRKFEDHTVSANILNEYVGQYMSPQMGLLHISKDGDKIFLRPDPVPGKEELIPMTDSTFRFANQDLQWQFYRKSGQVVGFGFEGKPDEMGLRQE